MSISQAVLTQTPRERLLQLVARYHAVNKNGTSLAENEQQELETLVMSELRMPLDRAKNLLVHLVQYSEDEDTDEEADDESTDDFDADSEDE